MEYEIEHIWKLQLNPSHHHHHHRHHQINSLNTILSEKMIRMKWWFEIEIEEENIIINHTHPPSLKKKDTHKWSFLSYTIFNLLIDLNNSWYYFMPAAIILIIITIIIILKTYPFSIYIYAGMYIHILTIKFIPAPIAFIYFTNFYFLSKE